MPISVLNSNFDVLNVFRVNMQRKRIICGYITAYFGLLMITLTEHSELIKSLLVREDMANTERRTNR